MVGTPRLWTDYRREQWTQKQKTVLCEVLRETGLTLITLVDIPTQKRRTVRCEVLTDFGHTVENSIGHSDTVATDD